MIVNNKFLNYSLYKYTNPNPRYKEFEGIFLHKNNEWYFMNADFEWVYEERNPYYVEEAKKRGLEQCDLIYFKEYLKYWGSKEINIHKIPFYF